MSILNNTQAIAEQLAYDTVPYPRAVFPLTFPDHLEMIGRLFAIDAPDSEHARVLEIGCAHGSNLIPMAVELPNATFYGIDISPIQVAQAKDDIRALDLKNIRVEQLNILDLNASHGTFDYIVTHGIYSWVPAEVREGILRAIQMLLAPTGIAFLSYNTNPGWKMRGILRDMVLFHTRGITDVPSKIAQARGIVKFIAANTAPDTAYASYLKSELEHMERWPDSFLYHDLLEGTNDAFYLSEVIESAREHGLAYLGDSELYSMFKSNFSAEVQEMLAPIGGDIQSTEQYLDFIRNRVFRQSLFVHDGVPIDRRIGMHSLSALSISARMHPADPNLNILSQEPAVFASSTNKTIQTAQPIVKAALMYLREHWSQPVPFEELFERAIANLRKAEKLAGSKLGSFDRERLKSELGDALIYFLSTDAISLHVHPYRFTLTVSEKPVASPLARMEAARGTNVANMRHERVDVGLLSAAVLTMLDGTHDREWIADRILQLTEDGSLTIDIEGKPLLESPHARNRILQEVDQTLLLLARGGLLIG